MTIHELTIGQTASFSKTITETDITLYAAVSGDHNPAHTNEEYAKGTPYGRRIAHGMLSAGLISAVLANKLPGPGNIYLSQELRFVGPVYIGDTLTATATVIEINEKRNRVKLETTVTNQDGGSVINGYAVVMPPIK